jgi:hypothetical protein
MCVIDQQLSSVAIIVTCIQQLFTWRKGKCLLLKSFSHSWHEFSSLFCKCFDYIYLGFVGLCYTAATFTFIYLETRNCSASEDGPEGAKHVMPYK